MCKASAGAVEHLPIAQVRNIADFLADAQGRGPVGLRGRAADGVADQQPEYGAADRPGIGAEGRGLRPRVRASCDQLVALPLRGRMESLNVSAAAAVLLYDGILHRPG